MARLEDGIMNYSRRDLSLLLPALLAAAVDAQESVLPSKVYPFDSLPVKTNLDSRMESRQVFSGATHSGYHLDLHISTLPPGQMPHPPHHHVHEEMMLIQEGTLEATISGRSTTAGPGSVIYIHSNEEHGLKNTGDVAAQYFVLAMGNKTA